MKAKEKLQRFLSMFLACIMILNTPMSVLASDLQVWNAMENVQFTAEESASSGSVSFSDEGFAGESENLSENVTDANLFMGENPENGGIENTDGDMMELFSDGAMEAAEQEYPFVITANGTALEVTDKGTTVECSKFYRTACEVSITVPEGTELLTIEATQGALYIVPEHGNQIIADPTAPKNVELTQGYTFLCMRDVVGGGVYHVEIIEGASEIAVTGVTLDKVEVTLEAGQTETLTATVGPDNATDKTVTWTSSDETVATVVDGVVTAVAAGTAIITAAAGEKSTTCTVTVTAPKIQENYKPVTVYFSLSSDAEYAEGYNGDVAVFKKITVPYFDLGLYGLEEYYFSSESYGDDGDGMPGSNLQPGTAEYAAGKITALHLFIYATEALYLGIDEENAGKGYLYNEGLVGTEIFTVSGGVGSLFFTNFWNLDMNFNYYLNYEYPLASEGWGATADQLLLEDGDIVTLGQFSNYGFYSDSASIFNYIVADNVTPAQGEEVLLTVMCAGPNLGTSYDTAQNVVTYEPEVYYTSFNGIENGDVTTWTYLGTADENGQIKLDTSNLTPGQYFVAIPGQYGQECPDEICSTPGGVLLTVEESAIVEVEVESVTLDKAELTLVKDRTATLTATVTPENATDKTVTWTSSDETVATVADGVVTAVSAGTATITAAAGKLTEECTVTVKEIVVPEGHYQVTVKVGPKEADVTFYSDKAAATEMNADNVYDEGIVDGYHQYTVVAEEGTYSYRAVEGEQNLGGMEFKVPIDDEYASDGTLMGKGQVLSLKRVNYYTTNTNITKAEDITLHLYPKDLNEAVSGTNYVAENGYVTAPIMINAAGNALTYQGFVDINGELGESYAVEPLNNLTFSPAASTESRAFTVSAVTWYSITAPAEAKVQMFRQANNYNVVELPVNKTETLEDGTVKSYFATPGGRELTYRVSMKDKVTRAGYATSTNKDMVFTFGANENPKSTKTTAARIENSSMVNINARNNLKMSVGETFRLRSFRAGWQIINTDTANIMIEPDFNYRIVSGAEHITMTPATNKTTGNAGTGANSNWMDIKALSAGTVVIEVSYDAIQIGGDTTYPGTFGAVDPSRKSVVVLQIGETSGNTLVVNSVNGNNPSYVWDVDFDTVYFTGETGEFNFTATMGGANPDKVELSTDLGGSWTEVSKNEGVYNAKGLINGNNILRVTTGGSVEYQVVRASRLNVTTINMTRSGDTIIAGDKVRVMFSGIYTPVPKMSGIYNPGFSGPNQTIYEVPEGAAASSSSSQYGFAADNQYDLTFTEAGTYTFTGGYITSHVMGDATGEHRAITDSGRGTNFNAGSGSSYRSIMPDLTFEVIGMPVVDVTVVSKPEGAAIEITDEAGTVLETKEDGTYELEYATYSYKATMEGYVPERGKFTVGGDDRLTGKKTVTIEMRAIGGTIWDGAALTEPQKNEDGAYLIGTGAELAWFAANHGSANAILTSDISLGGFSVKISNYAGTFDGNGHYINDFYGSDSLFYYVASGAVIKNLGVSGEIASTNIFGPGGIAIASGTNVKFEVQNCVSRVNITSSGAKLGGAGGIVGNAHAGSTANLPQISNCYNAGTVKGSGGQVGGIAGYRDTNPCMWIKNCYNIGTVSAYGISRAGRGTNSNNYYLLGSAPETSRAAGTAVQGDALKTYASTFGDAYMDNPTSYNDGYPILTWEEPRALAVAVDEFGAALDTYKNAEDYREAQQTELANAIAEGKKAIAEAATLKDAQSALEAAKAVMDAIKTDAELPPVVAVESVSLDKTEVTLETGATETLTATVTPEDATDKTVTWTSSDETVVTVADGVVTAVAAGTAIITATAGEKTATCEVTVTKVKPLISVTAGGKEVELTAFETAYCQGIGYHMVLDEMSAITVTGKDAISNYVIDIPTSDFNSKELVENSITFTVEDLETIAVTKEAMEQNTYWKNSESTWKTTGKKVAGISFNDPNFMGYTILFIELPDVVEVTEVTLNKTEVTLEEGATETLTATVTPENATDKTVVWTTSDETVATVADGVVTAVAAGTATITATAGDKTVTCTVTVKEPEPKIPWAKGSWIVTANGVEMPIKMTDWNAGSVTVPSGVDITFTLVGKTIVQTYANSKFNNHTSNEDGGVTFAAGFLKSGKYVQLECDTDPWTAMEGYIQVNIVDNYVPAIAPFTMISGNERIQLITNKDDATADTATYTATIDGGNDVTFKIFDRNGEARKNVTVKTDGGEAWNCTIDNKGNLVVPAEVIAANVKGNVETTILFEADGTEFARMNLTVVVPTVAVESVTLNKTETTITAGRTETLTATVTPEDATDKTVTWTSSDETVVTVADGVVTAVAAGTATITAKAGEQSAECIVTVKADKNKILLEGNADIANIIISDVAVKESKVSEDGLTVDVVLEEDTAKDATVQVQLTTLAGFLQISQVNGSDYATFKGNIYTGPGVTPYGHGPAVLTDGKVTFSFSANSKQYYINFTIAPSAADLEAAAKAEESITALPAVNELKVEDEEAVKAARAAYEALTEEQKALVSEETVKALEAAEAKMEELLHVHIWDEGTVTKEATCKETGVKTFTCACGETKTETIEKSSHSYGEWKTLSKATVFKAEVQERTCSVCGESEQKNVGKALKAVLELPGKLKYLQKGHSVKFAVTMAKGDSIASVKSSKKQYLKVSGVAKKSGKITLKGLKAGTSSLTITLASGKTKTYKVQVTNGLVKTKKLTVNNVSDSKLILKKGTTFVLETAKVPFSSSQKIAYQTSNKKIVSVSSTGELKALKAGKAVITVTSGSKKVDVTVTVPGITNVKSKVTVKQNKTLTLKPKTYGLSGKVTYASSDKSVAKVSSKGKITGVAPGKAVITISCGGQKVKTTVTVPGIANVKSKVTVKKNKTLTLKPELYGISGTVTYQTSNKKIATVTSKGKIKGIKKGTADITIKAGDFTKTVQVQVQ